MLKRNFKYHDYTLLITILLLCMFGVLMVYSASMITAVARYNFEPTHFFTKQIIWVILAFIAMFIFMNIPYRVWNSSKVTLMALGACLAMLVWVKLFGRTANNATSWLSFGGFNIQPAEVVKVAVILYLAAMYSRKQRTINIFSKTIIPSLFIPVILVGFVFFQPDAGSALIIAGTAGLLTICSGMSWKNILKIVMIGVVALVVLFNVLSEEQLSRFKGVTDPLSDVQGDNFQLIMSLQAIESGGLTGRGLGESMQKFGYLPEAHTDFILSIIAEETGIFGVAFVLLGIFIIIARGLAIARTCPDTFGSLVALGISALFAVQTIVNVGGLLALLPLTGVTLPFISYGGSSMITLGIASGILLNISMTTRQNAIEDKKLKITDQLRTKGNVTYLS